VVWRAVGFLDPVGDNPPEPDWEMVGLYDLTNPEFCFGEEVEPGVFEPTDCDAPNPQRLPDCFSDKRANCFEFKSDGTVEFFDRDIYNGFTYQYAVSTFDYGFAGNVAPRGFDGDMVFSPRSAQESSDQAYPRSGSSNRVEFQVNVVASGNLDSVIVVPNPLRRQGGWDTGDQSTVRFVNVTRNATCEIFTLAGDLVRTLTNAEVDNEQRGNIQWDTRNGAGEEVASGVYLYRITDDQGGETIGRFTIIR